ncbi:MAG: ECF transporter S component [Bacteroidota bacterium]|nr:ECF transporter S component [Bacteroidota bacterium]
MPLSLRKQFRLQTSGVALPLIAMGIGINLVMGEITALARIPLYLDSIGTIFIAASCGMYAGVVCGILSNIVAGIIFNPMMIFFAPVSAVIGMISGWFGLHGGFRKLLTAAPLGILQGIISALVSAPIAAFVFGGMTLGGTDFLVLYFRSIGKSILDSVLYQGLTSDPVDKCVSYIIVALMLQRLPLSLRVRLPQYSASFSTAKDAMK